MKELFEEWLENPATEVFMKYLIDCATEESELLADSILNGSIISELEQVRVSTICVTLQRIAEIDYNEIEELYSDRSATEQNTH